MIRFGQIGRLKRECIDKYVRLHAEVCPEVIQTIYDCHIHNYSIFLEDDVVFAYFEYTGDDYTADCEKMASDPITQKWWALTRPCFTKYSSDKAEAFYTDMRQIFFA